MSHIPTRVLGAAATAALVIAPFANAGSAQAAPAKPHRATSAMGLTQGFGEYLQAYSKHFKLDGRSTRTTAAALELAAASNKADGFNFIGISGLADRNHNGIDDDAKIAVRVFDNVATLTLHKNGTFLVSDGGFVFHNRLSVLKESAQSFDRVLRFIQVAGGGDSWTMSIIKAVKTEMPTGVRVVSDYDGNHDGYDDDGRLTFLANGKAVTLTIGNTGKQVGKVTYGPTWRTKAPKRTHHPVKPVKRAPASMLK